MNRWLELLHNQAGLTGRLDGDTVTLKPKSVLLCSPEYETFSLEVQVPSEAQYVLTVNDRQFRCKCADSPGGADAVHIDSAEPLRVPVVIGSDVRLALEASWLSSRGAPARQTLFDGIFKVPETLDKFGAPGYTVSVPHLGTLAYLSVGNIMSVTGTQLEFLSFNIVLLS
jgi:hypothetical protein